jgi:hypothetical protein
MPHEEDMKYREGRIPPGPIKDYFVGVLQGFFLVAFTLPLPIKEEVLLPPFVKEGLGGFWKEFNPCTT